MNNKYLKLAVILLGLTAGSLAQATTDWSTQDYDLYPGDFDGNGKTDLLYVAKSADKVSGIAISDGTGPNTLYQSWTSNYLGINWSGNQYTAVVGDFNHDGKSDVLLQKTTSGDSYLLFANSQGQLTSISQTIASTSLGLSWTADQHKLQAGDFNSDGFADLFFQATTAAGEHAVVYADSNGQFTITPPSSQRWNDGFLGLNWSVPKANVFVGKFNAGSADDLLVQAKPNFVMIDYDVTFPVPTYPNNKNGIAFSQGTTTPFDLAHIKLWSRMDYDVDWSPLTNTLLIGDFNGDGISDVILQARYTGKTSYLLPGNNDVSTVFDTKAALANNVNWSAGNGRLIAGNFDGGNAVGVYVQALSTAGTNTYINTVTGTSVTPATQGSIQTSSAQPVTSAGSTAGSFNVSATGAAAYQIPITLPPGPRGIQPNLAITYNSQGGGGTMGPGWGLSGLSAITRCPKTIAQDGVMDSVKLTDDDKFCINGNRLRAVSGSYGADGSVYHTEMADFSKIIAYRPGGTSVTNGPESFEVWGKDGLIYEYGSTEGSRVLATSTSTVTQWLLNKVKDRNGNNYVVTYTTGASGTSGAKVPDKISYTPSTYASTTAYNYTVNFSYGADTDQGAEVGYVGGTLVKNTNLLTSVTVKYGSSIVRQYSLSYQVSPSTTRARLGAVQECAGSSANDCLAPTLITYQDSESGVIPNTTSAFSGGATASAVRTKFDFNGDGLMDIAYFTGQWYVALATGSGFGSAISTGITDGNALIDRILGDNKDGFLASQSGVWWSYRFSSNSFSGTSTGISVDASSQSVTADTNGDGLPDLVTIRADGWIYIRLNTSSGATPGFAAATSTVYWGTPNQSNSYIRSGSSQTIYNFLSNAPYYIGTPQRTLDFNGDGRQDLIGIWYNSNTGYTYTYPIISTGTTFVYGAANSWDVYGFMNFNDDACTDIIQGGGVYVSACNGVSPAWVPYSPYNGPATSMDWNGDGRTDLLVNVNGYVGVYLSTGVAFSSLITTTIPIDRFISADNNGDGLDDLLSIGAAASTFTAAYRLHSGSGRAADLVASINNGYGATYQPIYTSIAQSNYTQGSGATYPQQDFTAAMYVVSQVVASDGINGTYTQTYNYTGARREQTGRGFAGFTTRTVTDNRADTPVVKTTYRTDFPYTGMVSRQDVYQHNGTTPISTSWSTPAVLALDSTANNQRYFPYAAYTDIDTFEVGGVKNGQIISYSHGASDYDNYGNVITQSKTVYDYDAAAPNSPNVNQSWTTSVSGTIDLSTDAINNWCISLPTQVQISSTSTVSGDAAAPTRITNLTPEAGYAKCRIAQQVVTSNASNAANYAATTVFAYDDFGNVQSQTVTGSYDPATGAAMSARTTSADWGTTGQFPLNTWNALNQQSTAEYNFAFGLQTKSKDPNNIETNWTYDNFGRKQTEVRPDGTSTQYNYYNCASVGCQSGDPAGATTLNKMVVVATSKNSSGGVVRDDWSYLDAFGRTLVSKSKTLNGGYTRVGTVYDALGRITRQSIPCDAASCAAYWTSNWYDAAGRVVDQARPISASSGVTLCTSVSPLSSGCQASHIDYKGLTTITTDPQGKTTTKIVDPIGRMRRSQDHNGYYQDFSYDALGSLVEVQDSLSNTLFQASYAYGISAFQTQTIDKDLGTWNYRPNALGEVTGYTDAKTNVFTLEYDKLSRPTKRSVSGESTATWVWGTSAAAHEIGQLKAVGFLNGSNVIDSTKPNESYSYDSAGRLLQKDITQDSTTYSYNYAYNALGAVDTLTYPDAGGYRLQLKYEYDPLSGMLKSVKDNAAGTVYWQVNSMNSRMEITQETLGNGIVTNRSFDPVTGWLNSIQSGAGGGATAQNESYLFDKLGNVIQRQNSLTAVGQTENFYYDNLYRLDYSTLNATTNLDLTYDALGRITQRTDVASNASWSYGDANHLHGVTQAGSSAFTYSYDPNGNAQTRNGQSISWNKYNYPTLINNSSTENVTLSYDANHQRWQQVYVNGSSTETTNYIGGLLEKVVTGSSTDYRHYIYSQTNTAAVAVLSRVGTTNTVRYVLDDHQQSPSNIRDASGNLVVGESFTAFGARRNWNSWTGGANSSELSTSQNITRQGYTWQTALGNMGLNHMNGRVQDAITGVFLSADPYINEPGNTQNYNRYSYVYNNPLSLTDPSGFWACDWTMGYNMGGGIGSGTSYGSGKSGWSNNVAAGVGGSFASASQADMETYFGRAEWTPGMTDLMSYKSNANQLANTRYEKLKLNVEIDKASKFDPKTALAACTTKGCWTTSAEISYLDEENFLGYYSEACEGGDLNACFDYGVASGQYPGPSRVLLGGLINKGYSLEEASQLVQLTIPLNLAKSYANLLPQNESQAVFPSAQAVAGYHWTEFSKYGLSSDVFGGTPFGKSSFLESFFGTSVLFRGFWCPLCSK